MRRWRCAPLDGTLCLVRHPAATAQRRLGRGALLDRQLRQASCAQRASTRPPARKPAPPAVQATIVCLVRRRHSSTRAHPDSTPSQARLNARTAVRATCVTPHHRRQHSHSAPRDSIRRRGRFGATTAVQATLAPLGRQVQRRYRVGSGSTPRLARVPAPTAVPGSCVVSCPRVRLKRRAVLGSTHWRDGVAAWVAWLDTHAPMKHRLHRSRWSALLDSTVTEAPPTAQRVPLAATVQTLR